MIDLSSATRDELVAEIHRLRADLQAQARPQLPLEAWIQAAIFHHANDAILVTDPAFRITLWNRAAEELYGWPLAEALGRLVGEVIPLVRYLDGTTEAAAQAALARDGLWRGEVVQRARGGAEVTVDAMVQLIYGQGGAVEGIVAINRNIGARKQAEEALRASEERFRQVVDIFPYTLVIYDAERRIEFINRAGLQIGGLPKEAMIGRRDEELFPPSVTGTYLPLLEEVVRTGQPRRAEVAFALPSGGYTVIITYIPLFDEGGALRQILGLTYDITERSQAEARLRRYAERLELLHTIDQETLAHTAPARLAEAVLARLRQLVPCEGAIVTVHDSEGILVLASDSGRAPNLAGKRLAFQEIEALRAYIADPSQPPPSAVVPDGLVARLMAGLELRSLLRIPLQLSDQTIGALALVDTDPDAFGSEEAAIASEVASQLAVAIQSARLREEEQQARRVAESLYAAGIALTASLDLDRVLATLLDVLAEHLAFDAASVILRDDADGFAVRTLRGLSDPSVAAARWPSEAALRGGSAFGLVLEAGRSVMIPDTARHPVWRSLPGTEQIRSWLGIPLVSKGEIIGIFSVDRFAPRPFSPGDVRLAETLAATAGAAVANAHLFAKAQREIVERRRAEAELDAERALLARRVSERTAALSAANAELARASRLKDEFLANMSHELRTPLNAILANGEAMQEAIYGPTSDRQQAALKRIHESGMHLLSLINDILDLSKIEAGKLDLIMNAVDVAGLCQSALRMVAQSAQARDITVSVDLDSAVQTVVADERRLKQILVNLLSNAVKFTDEGGAMGLEVRGDAPRQQVFFTIWDTGIGIAGEDLPRLFQPFTQVDSSLSRRYDGTGLGLALVLRLAEAHGGSVAVQSAPGQGSSFRVALPWHPGAIGAVAHDDRPQSPPGLMPGPAPGDNGGGAVRGRILLAEDHHLNLAILSNDLTARGYEVILAYSSAEVIALAADVAPDLVLMDIQMPSLDGLDVIRRIRATPTLRGLPVIALTALAMPGDRERCLAAGADDYFVKPAPLDALGARIAALIAG